MEIYNLRVKYEMIMENINVKNEIERDVVIYNLYEFDMKAWYKGYFGKIEESDGQYHNIFEQWPYKDKTDWYD